MGPAPSAAAERYTRNRREEAVVEPGRQAMANEEIDLPTPDALAAVAETFDAEYRPVHELSPGSDALVESDPGEGSPVSSTLSAVRCAGSDHSG